MKIAVIGSRRTRMSVMELMYGAVWKLATDFPDILWTSGGCKEGPDDVITRLAVEIKLNHKIFLPNKRRQLNTVFRGLTTVVACDNYFKTQPYHDIVYRLHRHPSRLQDWHYDLHGRNLNIISDTELDSDVDAVFYAAGLGSDGLPTGGTYMAVAYAKERNIPCFNAIDWNEYIEFIKFVNQ